MIKRKLSFIASGIKGRLVGTDCYVNQVTTDTRKISQATKSNELLFVALKGPHFDAHQFIHDLSSDVSAVVVDHLCDIDIPQIIVADTRRALADIARLNRELSDAVYVAITGSSGKTTVKEMVASILSCSGNTFATQGNLNNDIGVPLTLLSIGEDVEFAVVELGANHEGEIAYTADITKPKIALVNNISEAHLQGFGDIHGVARAKSEIYFALDDTGIAILNGDDKYYNYFESRVSNKKLSYSINEKADVYATDISLNADQSSSFSLNFNEQKQLIKLPLVGIHNVSNALAAASCSIALGIGLEQIALGLEKTPVVPGRLIVNNLPNGCTVIDDTYNANVSSMIAAIDLLSQYAGHRILVDGDIGELGEKGRECHEQIGLHARKRGIELMYSCGVLTQFSQRAFINESPSTDSLSDKGNVENRYHYTEQSELIIKLKTEAKDGVTILVKGSRSAHMENVVRALVDSTPANSENYTGNRSTVPSNVASLKGEQ